MWCHASNAAGLPNYIYVAAAVMRLREMHGCTTQPETVVGSRGKAAPALRNQTSAAWNTKAAVALAETETERQLFLDSDEELCIEYRKALTDIDSGDGVCCAFALMVRGAKDVHLEHAYHRPFF